MALCGHELPLLTRTERLFPLAPGSSSEDQKSWMLLFWSEPPVRRLYKSPTV